MQPIITAIISGLCVAIPSIIATIASYKNQKSASQDNTKLLTYRIDKLEQKVTQHNNLIDRMYKIENRVTLIEDDVKDLERGK